MNLTRTLRAPQDWARNPCLPLRSVRMRLTALYGTLFLLSGAVLLTLTYALAWKATDLQVGQDPLAHIVASPSKQRQLVQQHLNEIHQRAVDLHLLLASSGIALALTTLLSVALGWLVAGRALRPLRTMTAATQQISDQNLHQRLAMTGPDDELKRLGDTIDDLLARLESAFDAQRRFVANASHELRTPLTMMRTALEVATRKPDPPAGVIVLAGKVRVGLDRADRLVDAFLTLARAQYDGTVHRSVVALDGLVGTSLIQHCDGTDSMRLAIDQKCHHTAVWGDDALLGHLVDNLIDNAIRHNTPGGWIHIATDTDLHTARLVIENSGSFLDPCTVAELARPFRRSAPDRTDTPDTGVGLGLSIVAAITATHQGSLDLHARPDGGLRVTVTLPLAAQPVLTAAAA